MKRMLSVLSAIIALVLLSSAVILPAQAAVPSTYANEVLQLVNAERVKAGLPALDMSNAALNNAAKKRAEESSATVGLTHTRPDGTEAVTVLAEYGLTYTAFAENLARGQTSPEDVMNGVYGWMNSAGHRANILNGDYTHIGIGIYESSTGELTWVQLFLRGGDGAGGGGSNPYAVNNFFVSIWNFFVNIWNTIVTALSFGLIK